MLEFNSDVINRLEVAAAVVNARDQGSLGDHPSEVFTTFGYQPPATDADWAALHHAAEDLANLLSRVVRGNKEAITADLNSWLARHQVTLHLELRQHGCLLHFHPEEADFAEGWAAGAAAALAIALSTNEADRVGQCAARECSRFFVDRGRNKQRRFCSLRCQNRTKSATYRARRSP